MNPQVLHGPWNEGFSLDVHTLKSTKVGEYPNGRPIFETIRSDIGEALFLLKYRDDLSQIPFLVDQAENFITKKNWIENIELITCCPPTRKREVQPIIEITKELAKKLNKPFDSHVLKKNNKIGAALKDIDEKNEKLELLNDIYSIRDKNLIKDVSLLIIDDIYHTGATAETITNLLLSNGAKFVNLLYYTKRRG